MVEEIRTFHFPLPDGWEAAAGVTVPPLPWMRQSGVAVDAIRSVSYPADGSVLALYAVRGTKTAVETLASALREEVAATTTAGTLSWAVATEQWVSLNALLEPDAVAGPAVLCSTRFTHAAADEHLDTVVDALEHAEWRW